MHIVSKCQVTRSQPSHSVVVKVSTDGIVKCAAIGIGARSMLSDFGMCADVAVRTDSSSGLAVGSRRGLGRLWHVQTRYLVGTATSTAGRPSLEEGAGRHERE